MVECSCYVPGCGNNWRNSPDMGFQTLASDPGIRMMYIQLMRNATLKRDTLRIGGVQFPRGMRMSRGQLKDAIRFAVIYILYLNIKTTIPWAILL